MDNNNIMPDISFELGSGDLSISDIQNQTQALSTDNNDQNLSINDYNEHDSNITEYDNSSSYNMNSVDEFKIDSPDDFKNQIQEQMNDGSYSDEVTDYNNEYDGNYQQDDTQEEPDYDTSVYSAALQIIKDQGILNIPDEISELDENTLQDLIAYDQELRNQQAIDYVRSSTGDPRLTELIDHVLQGGTYEDAIVMKEIIDEQYNFAEVDTTQEDNQRMLIEMYIKEGLNPESAVDQRRLSRLDEEIDNYISNLEGEDLANEAKEYFINKIEYIKQMEQQKVMEHQMQMMQYEEQKRQQEQMWINNFKKSLNEKPWSNDKKKEIVNQFDIVQLDNGEEMELWKYKYNKIWENPDLTQIFMDFLSDLDPYELQFKNRSTPVQKQVTSKILDIINNKKTVSNKFKSEGRSYNTSKQKEQPKRTINPSSDW